MNTNAVFFSQKIDIGFFRRNQETAAGGKKSNKAGKALMCAI